MIRDVIKEFFSFSQREQRGILVLVALIGICWLLYFILPLFYPIDRAKFELYEKQAVLFLEYINKQKDSVARAREWESKTYSHSGTSQKNYSEDQGVFCQSPSSKLSIESGRKAYPKGSGYGENSNSQSFPPKKNRQEVAVCNISIADSNELTRIYGIGKILSSRIVKYRKLLGGFYSVWQLAEVYGIDSQLVRNNLQGLYADTLSLRRIPLEKASFKELLRHPYLNYDDVKLIMNKREALLKQTLSLDSLFSPEKSDRIKHYLALP